MISGHLIDLLSADYAKQLWLRRSAGRSVVWQCLACETLCGTDEPQPAPRVCRKCGDTASFVTAPDRRRSRHST